MGFRAQKVLGDSGRGRASGLVWLPVPSTVQLTFLSSIVSCICYVYIHIYIYICT